MRRLSLLIVAAALLSGCEDDSVFRADRRTVAVVVDDYRYLPQHLSVGAGSVYFLVSNEGVEATSVVVRRVGERHREVGRVATIEPGQVGISILRLTPGRYELGSATSRHEVLGQRGTLIVGP